jgi:deoxyribodipyrimidine photo-lyase
MSKALVWFRQDLRIMDNPALYHACEKHSELIALYVMDDDLHAIQAKAQSWWLHHSLLSLDKTLKKHELSLTLKKSEPLQILKHLIEQHQITHIYWNRCYDPNSIARDSHIKSELKNIGINVCTYNSALLNEPWQVKNKQGDFFKVFTPYWRQCLKQISLPENYEIKNWPKAITESSDKLSDWQLCPNSPNWAKSFPDYWSPGELGAQTKLKDFIKNKLQMYKEGRDQPARKATSNLSPHLHFGEISPWFIFKETQQYLYQHADKQTQVDHFISELGWREFSYYLLYHFPKLATDNFKAEFNHFPWHANPDAFKRWKKGQTGYPIVDAGMRELWHTGTMHNRVRMIVASFLIKDLFIDWREGAKWFDSTLLDADVASNNASWQWVAGSGADAAPYFRIFNPILQGEKFDPQGVYIKQWVPELKHVPTKWIHQPWMAPANELSIQNYPKPIVEHSKARDLALKYYQELRHPKS